MVFKALYFPSFTVFIWNTCAFDPLLISRMISKSYNINTNTPMCAVTDRIMLLSSGILSCSWPFIQLFDLNINQIHGFRLNQHIFKLMQTNETSGEQKQIAPVSPVSPQAMPKINQKPTLSVETGQKEALKSNTPVPMLSFLHLLQFSTSIGFSIENTWITMLMITFKTPAQIDTFVWIVPILLAIAIRPYFVRFIHRNHQIVSNQWSMIGWMMALSAFGCFMIAHSTKYSQKQFTKRIIFCSIGWTIMDLSYQFALFLASKLQERQNQSSSSEQNSKNNQGEDKLESTINWNAIGLTIGYLFSIALCLIFRSKTIKVI